MTTIDLRSDTVTLPSPAMREAIARTELGDDVYGEDPTVNRLEALAAEKMGKEAALLVSSGTMGNLLALLAHCERGQRVVVGNESHIYNYEAGGASALGGIMYHPLATLPDGRLDPEGLNLATRATDDPHAAPAGLVCLENTHNRCGGTVLPPDYLASVHSLTRERGLPLHMDGARVFNAAVALGIDVRELTQHVDSVQFCLSKGLAAPVGSMLAGSQPLVARARRLRKMIGGGMRQAGIIAAAGIVALTEMVDRLADDHANARLLAEGLTHVEGLRVNLQRVQSDIVVFELEEHATLDPAQFIAGMREHGVLVSGMGGRRVRAVTHYGISASDVDTAVTTAQHVLDTLVAQ